MKHKLKINGKFIDVNIEEWCSWIVCNIGRSKGSSNFISGVKLYSREPNRESTKEYELFTTHSIFLDESLTVTVENVTELNDKFNFAFKSTINDFLDKYEARTQSENGDWMTDKEHEETYPNLNKKSRVDKTVAEIEKEFQEKYKEEFGPSARIAGRGYHDLKKENEQLKQTIVSMAIKLESK